VAAPSFSNIEGLLMTTISHPDLVAALKKPGADILASLTPEKVDVWHMASCIPGETGELMDAVTTCDLENIIEELGDIEFYIEGLCQALNFNSERFEIEPWGATTSQIAGRAAEVFDAVKKWVIYEKDLDIAAIGLAIVDFERVLTHVRRAWGITREQTIEHNIAKLSKRYASLSYSDQAARDRADKA
jgi:hypothetical protein